MQPKLTVVTFRPVRPRVLYCGLAGEMDAAAGAASAVLLSETLEVLAKAAAGSAALAARNLRRDESDIMVPPNP